ncbi:hypothetical protein D5086_004012 [Populus alba]|uniref:Uncharacterized protein n=1 Tax=Populus alba TaxID=43335 RepID=A0ACC4CQB1_POPAL
MTATLQAQKRTAGAVGLLLLPFYVLVTQTPMIKVSAGLYSPATAPSPEQKNDRFFLGSSCSTSLLKLLKMDSVGLQSRETSDQAAFVMESPPEKEAITVGWRDAINKVIPAVVVLHVGPSTSNFLIGTATGLVVEKNRAVNVLALVELQL